ncbi:50S ribosomal protein L33 [bacterium]|nr:50S ribosomal protein L33 [bacterium]
MARDVIILACTECKAKNYTYSKNKRIHPERVEYKKFCPKCGKHTLHKESR